MTFNLASFTFALLKALDIYARVMARDGLVQRPEFASKAVLGRLRTGIRALEAYLRRVLILMALEMEHELVAVVHPENLKRAKAKKPPRAKKYCLQIFPADMNSARADAATRFLDRSHHAAAVSLSHQDVTTSPPVVVPISCWLDRLDHLQALAKDPVKKARRLAYTLARCRPGILMPPTRIRVSCEDGAPSPPPFMMLSGVKSCTNVDHDHRLCRRDGAAPSP